jgi:hypothetical protein
MLDPNPTAVIAECIERTRRAVCSRPRSPTRSIGATVPFVARYRKEATGALDDAQLRTLEERLRYVRELEERRAAILDSISQQGRHSWCSRRSWLLRRGASGRMVASYCRWKGLTMTNTHFAVGQVLFREGDPADSVFRAVDIFRELNGEPILLGTVGAGQFIGEMGVVENRPRGATARAASEVEVEILAPAEFFDQIAGSPPAARE